MVISASVCVCAVLVLASMTECRAPNGSVGAIDFRYPDHIVAPVVSCPSEGVFPHPHDCTWYYRCYDRYDIGHFWRAYFQCEPGTYFSDELDQCVFEGNNTGCVTRPETVAANHLCREVLVECRQTTLCPNTLFGTSFTKTVEICYRSTRLCQMRESTQLCPANFLYDNTNKVCIPESHLCAPQQDRPAVPDILCEDRLFGCSEQTLCRNQTSPKLYRFCEVYHECYHRDGRFSSTLLCKGGVLDADTNTCVRAIDHTDYCIPETAPVISPSMPCYKETEECFVYKSCTDNEVFLGCTTNFVCREAVGGTRKMPVCAKNQMYVEKWGRCLKPRVSRSDNPTDVCQPTYIMSAPNDPPSPSAPVALLDYTCRRVGQRPGDVYSNTPALSCYNRTSCDADGNPANDIFGCDSFYECRYNFESSNVVLYQVSCEVGWFYNYQFKICGDVTAFHGNLCPATPTPTESPPPIPTPSNSSLNLDIVINCAYDNETPDMPENAQKIYCSTNALCTNGTYLSREVICNSFYRCVVNLDEGTLQPVLESCAAPMQHSPAEKKCIVPSTNYC